MNAAREKGLAVTALFSFTPPKFRHKLLRHEPAEDSYGNRPTPLGINNFAYFCAAAVERYNRGKYKLQYAEIWNEPNLSPSGADPAEYVELIKVTNAAIKNAKKDVQVSIGGLGPSANSGLWLSPPSFLQKLYDYGLLNTDYDAISVHPYSEDAGTVYYRWSTFSQIEATHPSIYSVLHENLADDKQIWLTEFGAPTKGPGKVHTLANPDVAAYNPDVDYVDPALQRAIVQKIFNYRFRNANVLPDHRYMYTLMDKPGGSNEDGYGAYDIRGNFKWARNHQAA